MPIPGPSAPAPAGDTIERHHYNAAGPFWLRIAGEWIHLDGVVPGSSVATQRPRSEWVSVGGHRHTQQAQRGPRDWSFDVQYATPTSVAALQVAAEGGEVWLLDTSASAANMLDPRATHSLDETDPVMLCGGVPLRCFTSEHAVTHPVRVGSSYTASVWTDAVEGEIVATVSGVTESGNILAPEGSGATRQATATFTPDDNDDVVLTVLNPVDWRATGLQLVENAVPVVAWQAGQRTPCRVSVEDPSQEMSFLRGRVALSQWSLIVREVSS